MNRLFPSDIAKELVARFSDENRGHRSYFGVRDRMKILKTAGISASTLRNFRDSENKNWQAAREGKKGGRPRKNKKGKKGEK